MRKTFLVLGPTDHNDLPLFWSKEKGDWVERDEATLYTGKEVFSFPPRELPSGARGIIDIETRMIHTPRVGRVSENS